MQRRRLAMTLLELILVLAIASGPTFSGPANASEDQRDPGEHEDTRRTKIALSRTLLSLVYVAGPDSSR